MNEHLEHLLLREAQALLSEAAFNRDVLRDVVTIIAGLRPHVLATCVPSCPALAALDSLALLLAAMSTEPAQRPTPDPDWLDKLHDAVLHTEDDADD